MAHRPRILIVDDNPNIRDAVEVTLRLDGYDFLTAENGRVALATAFSTAPDLIVLDLVMPELDGIACCHALKHNLSTRSIPVVMLTGEADPEKLVLALEAGADDYVTKPFNPRELRARVASLLRRTQRYVDTDPVTKLPGNRQLRAELDHRLRRDEFFAVGYVDLDDFKAYVDHYGFENASRVIQKTAQLLYSQLVEHGRPDDFIGHLGGDDFAFCTSPDLVDAVGLGIVAAFDAACGEFYDEATRELGVMRAHDRSGQLREFPLMTITVAALLVAPGTFADLERLGEWAAHCKEQLKRVDGSNYQRFSRC